MLLNVQCNRVAFCFIQNSFLYIFADSPHGSFFLQKKQSSAFKDFDYLVDALLTETRKAYSKRDAQKFEAELFDEHFWGPQLFRIHVGKIISLFERDYGGLSSAIDIHTNEGSVTSLVFTCYTQLQSFIQNVVKQKPLLLRYISSCTNDIEGGIL